MGVVGKVKGNVRVPEFWSGVSVSMPMCGPGNQAARRALAFRLLVGRKLALRDGEFELDEERLAALDLSGWDLEDVPLHKGELRQSLTRLSLRHCELRGSQVTDLFRALPPLLQSIDVGGNLLCGPGVVDDLCKTEPLRAQVTELGLSGCGLCDKHVAILASTLAGNDQLIVLDLNDNEIGNAGALAVADNLLRSGRELVLESLHLARNAIDAVDVAVDLAFAAQHQLRLRVLSLFGNKDDLEEEALATSLLFCETMGQVSTVADQDERRAMRDRAQVRDAIVPCPFSCGASKVRRHTLEFHFANTCAASPTFCDACGNRVPVAQMAIHAANECLERVWHCANQCGATFQRKRLPALEVEKVHHEDHQCPLRPTPCSYDCGHRLPFREIAEHQAGCDHRWVPCAFSDCPVGEFRFKDRDEHERAHREGTVNRLIHRDVHKSVLLEEERVNKFAEDLLERLDASVAKVTMDQQSWDDMQQEASRRKEEQRASLFGAVAKLKQQKQADMLAKGRAAHSLWLHMVPRACPFPQCLDRVLERDMAQHQRECPNRPTPCPRENCDEVVASAQLDSHLATSCLERIVVCQRDSCDGLELKARGLDQHNRDFHVPVAQRRGPS